MGDVETYRSAFSRALAAVTMVLCGLVIVSLAASREVEPAVRYGPPLALLAFLSWAAYWRPYVEVSDGGVLLANVWRTVHVPWPALEEVETRLGLRLVTAYGTYHAWAVPAPHRRRSGPESPVPGEAAALVTARWSELRKAGYLDDRKLERPHPRVTLHVGTAALTGALLLLTVTGALLSL